MASIDDSDRGDVDVWWKTSPTAEIAVEVDVVVDPAPYPIR